jgi:hypothetical protein
MIHFNTSIASQKANLYPIDQLTVPVDVTVLDDSTGLPIANTGRVHLVRTDTKAVIMSSSTNASGVASIDYSYISDVAVQGWVRQMDLVGTDYIPKDIAGTISSQGLSLTVRLSELN